MKVQNERAAGMTVQSPGGQAVTFDAGGNADCPAEVARQFEGIPGYAVGAKAAAEVPLAPTLDPPRDTTRRAALRERQAGRRTAEKPAQATTGARGAVGPPAVAPAPAEAESTEGAEPAEGEPDVAEEADE